MSGMNGTELAGSEMGMAPVNGVMPGTQQDLVVNVGDRVFLWLRSIRIVFRGAHNSQTPKQLDETIRGCYRDHRRSCG